MEAVEKNYIDGRAKHVAAPEESVFRIISNAEYNVMGPNKLADILKRQHIVVKDIGTEEDLRFDEAGLKTLSPLHAIIEMQGNPTEVCLFVHLKYVQIYLFLAATKGLIG